MISYKLLGLYGRLGNHLWQVASCLGIADKLNTTASFPAWKYEKHFKNPLPHNDAANNKVIEHNYTYDESIIQNNADYSGAWLQSEKYWQHCKEKVLQQFEFNDTIIDTVKKLYKVYDNTVAISVRRGDFVNNPNYFQIPITYYINAYYEHFDGCPIIIFTDDFAYCKKHLNLLPNVQFADGLNDIEQLALMSLCKNHIISNSTFSWWGAYLSQSENVIRPERNLDGELAKKNSERDYWPQGWKVFNDYRIDLTDTTFIIPVHFDHVDRRQNLLLTLAFLREFFNTNIIIGEQGGKHFKDACIYSGSTYIPFNYDVFHRTRMINEMAKASKTPIIANWDCDNICTPLQILSAVNEIRNGSDIAYPFDGTVQRVPRYLFAELADSLDTALIDEKKCNTKHSSVGHAVIMNKQSFIAAGMENEKFISWGPEDSERFNRYNILGLKVKRTPGAIYHVDHHVGENSSTTNKFFHNNEREFMKVASSKSKQQLQEYIRTWDWCN